MADVCPRRARTMSPRHFFGGATPKPRPTGLRPPDPPPVAGFLATARFVRWSVRSVARFLSVIGFLPAVGVLPVVGVLPAAGVLSVIRVLPVVGLLPVAGFLRAVGFGVSVGAFRVVGLLCGASSWGLACWGLGDLVLLMLVSAGWWGVWFLSGW